MKILFCNKCKKEFKVKNYLNQKYCSYECYWNSKTTNGNRHLSLKCKCGREFISSPRNIISGRAKFCSKKCLYKYRTRPSGLRYNIKVNNTGWFKKILGKYIDEKGYYRITMKNNKHIREHRLIMEKYIGRKLKVNEVVHHINGVKTDNRVENLELMTANKHNMIHRSKLCIS